MTSVFPAVTFCNINPFNELDASQYINEKMEKVKFFENIETCLNMKNKTSGALDVFVDRIKRTVANDK